jgi:hypothetical protein
MRRVEVFELIPAPRGAESPSGLETHRAAVAAVARSRGQPDPGGAGEGGSSPDNVGRVGTIRRPEPASKAGRCRRRTSVGSPLTRRRLKPDGYGLLRYLERPE